MSNRNERGMGRGRYRGNFRGGYHDYQGRGGPYGTYGQFRGRGGYKPQRYQPHGPPMNNMPPMPGGPGMVIPPEMLAELQKKLKEKFPDAEIPLTQEGMMKNMPIQLPVSNMRFKPPIHLVPNSSGYYGEANKKKQNKPEEKKETTETEKQSEESEVLFDNNNPEEQKVSQEEIDHFKELSTLDQMTPEQK